MGATYNVGMGTDFSQLLVKNYNHWSIYLHANQGYLGRCVVWCKRDDALDLTDATQEEQAELFLVLTELRRATKSAFGADWFNYAFLSNETKHLHGHFIPRYAKPKTFMRVVFEDKRYGHNYRTDHDFVTPAFVLVKVKSLLQKMLE